MNAYFHDDDTVESVVPQPLRTHSIEPNNPNLAASMHGGVIYVSLNPWGGIEDQVIDTERYNTCFKIA